MKIIVQNAHPAPNYLTGDNFLTNGKKNRALTFYCEGSRQFFGRRSFLVLLIFPILVVSQIVQNKIQHMSTAPAIFWPHSEHWSVKIPLKTPHYRMPSMKEKGYVVLKTLDLGNIPPAEWENLTYMDWKSGGDTNFAPLASCDGTIECKGFWENGKTDKHAIFTPNAEKAPELMKYIRSIPANFGRVRIIRLEPQTHDQAIRSVHRDDNNRLNPEDEGWVVRMWIELTDNPDSYMLLYDSDENNLPIKESESRVPMQKGSHFLVDSQRLWHVGVHNGTKSRYAAIISVESSPELEKWVRSKT